MNHKLLLQDLVDQLSEAGNIKKKEAEEFLRELFKTSEETLFSGENVKVKGLGVFKLIQVDSRKSVNVSTGEEIEIKAHYKLTFTPDPSLKELINKPYEHLEPIELDTVIKPETPIIREESNRKMIHEDTTLTENNTAETFETKRNQTTLKDVAEGTPPKKKYSVELMLWGIFLMLLAGLGTWSWYSNEAQKKEDAIKIKALKNMNSLQALNKEDSLIQTIGDSLKAMANDTTTIQDKTQKAEKENQVTKLQTKTAPTKESSKKTTTDAVIPTSITVKAGHRLTKLSEKYYGHKIFWVYIYEANKSIIKDPNVLPVGATITIPKADSKKINPNNPAAIETAKALQSKILTK